MWKWGLIVLINGALGCLSFWQWARGQEKAQWLTQVSQAKHPLSNADLSALASKSLVFSPAVLEGHWLAEKQFLLDNQLRSEPRPQLGYGVLTPFVLTDQAQVVLVDRGWVAAPMARALLPTVPPLPSEPLTIQGLFLAPSVNPWVHQTLEGIELTWPLRIQKIDWPLFEAQLAPQALVPAVLHLSASDPAALSKRLPVFALTPEKHQAYAVQWALLALVFDGCVFYFIRKGLLSARTT